MKTIKYKLYNREQGYKCLVTLQEVNFLFGYQVETIEEAAELLTHNATGYYITL